MDKKLNKRQKAFVHHYTEHSSKTYGVGKLSAIEAKYSVKNAESTASKLLILPHVCQAIESIETQWIIECNKSVEDKIKICWDNYQNALAVGEKKNANFWFKEHGLLRGDYVEHKEIKSKVQYSSDQETELTRLRGEMVVPCPN